MKDLFVPYQQSLELRELGFDEICLTHYWGENILNEAYGGWMKNSNTKYVMAPTWEQAFKWLRENYNTLATIYSNASGYLYEWHDTVGGTHRGWSEYEGPNDGGVWDTYEEAKLACITKLIEIVKTK